MTTAWRPEGRPQWLRRMLVLGAAALVAPAATAQQHGTVTSDQFRSDALGARKRYLVYLPPSYERDPARRFPVAYYLHGGFDDEESWVRQGRLDAAMDSLIATGMPEMIVVMPDGDDGFYTTWARPYDWRGCPQRRDLRETAERYCVRRPRYDEYIGRDLVRSIDATYRTLADARHRGIAGLSMGGFGAMALAAEYPDTWAAAASHSGAVNRLTLAMDTARGLAVYAARPDTLRTIYPSIWPILEPVFGSDSADWWAREALGRIRRMSPERRRRLPALYADIGTEDARLAANRAFRFELTSLGVPLDYHEYAGDHTWEYWRRHVAESLLWLSRHIAP